MPYRVRKQDCEQSDGTSGSHVVQKQEAVSWQQVSCHTNEADAEAAMRIREEAETRSLGHEQSDTVIAPGGQIKIAGGSRLGGYLVRFSSPGDPDLEGDFFTPETDFGPFRQSVVLYGHGMDEAMKRRVLDENAMLEVDDTGVWIEAQLTRRDDYEQMILRLAEEGKLGWSSGTATHLVETRSMGEATHITRWPLGLDASLTPTPAEPRNEVVTLKEWALPAWLTDGGDNAFSDRLKKLNSIFSDAGQGRALAQKLANINNELEGLGSWK